MRAVQEAMRLGNGVVDAVAFRPDGAACAVLGSLGLWLFDQSFRELAFRPMDADLSAIAWRPGSGTLAIATRDGTIELREGATDPPLTSIRDLGGAVTSLAWHPNGHRLAVVVDSSRILLWDVALDQVQEVHAGDGPSSDVLAWSPDGRWLASGGTAPWVVIWSAATWTRHARLEGHTDTVAGIVWSPDSSRLMTTAHDDVARQWDVPAGRLLTETRWDLGGAALTRGNWSDAGCLLVGWCEGTIGIVNTLTGEQHSAMDERTPSAVRLVDWAGDGRRFVTVSWNGLLQLWDRDRRAPLASLVHFRSAVEWARWRADGATLAIYGRESRSTALLWIWDPEGQVSYALPSEETPPPAWSPVNSLMALSSGSTVRLWDSVTGRMVRKLRGDSRVSKLGALHWSPDGARIAAVAKQHSIAVWDYARGEVEAVRRP